DEDHDEHGDEDHDEHGDEDHDEHGEEDHDEHASHGGSHFGHSHGDIVWEGNFAAMIGVARKLGPGTVAVEFTVIENTLVQLGLGYSYRVNDRVTIGPEIKHTRKDNGETDTSVAVRVTVKIGRSGGDGHGHDHDHGDDDSNDDDYDDVYNP
ncbi:hypothetical protein N9W79_02480, partial [bacterium]|nr:hypothetical protein [bacterium]